MENISFSPPQPSEINIVNPFYNVRWWNWYLDSMSDTQPGLNFTPLLDSTWMSLTSQAWHIGKSDDVPLDHPVILVGIPLLIEMIELIFWVFCFFFPPGITVWETDPRAGGRTPDRSEPAGAMQAGVRDGEHEQYQVRGPCPPCCAWRRQGEETVLFIFSFQTWPWNWDIRCWMSDVGKEL